MKIGLEDKLERQTSRNGMHIAIMVLILGNRFVATYDAIVEI
jgi:hypothetical protein